MDRPKCLVPLSVHRQAWSECRGRQAASCPVAWKALASESMDNETRASADDTLVKFYRGEHPDSSGRWLREIRSWGYDRLERTHDYIQWLFPMRSRSQFNPDAPTLNEALIREFRHDERLRGELALSFRQMLAFYGFLLREGEGGMSVERSSEWSARSRNWLAPGNHNFLRITRILTSLRILGLSDEADAFLVAL